MNQITYKKNITQLNTPKTNESLTHIQLGGSMALGQSFDIKNYLNSIESQQKNNKRVNCDFPPLFDNFYQRTKFNNKKYKLTSKTNEFLSTYNNKYPSKIKNNSLDISTTISFNNNPFTMKHNKISSYSLKTGHDDNSLIYNNTKTIKNTTKNYTETETKMGSLDFKNNFNIYNIKSENFNLLKTIKNIKKNTNLTRNDDEAIKHIMKNKIAFAPNESDIALKPINIINDFKYFRQKDLDKKRLDVSMFITDNQGISRRNLILKLLDNQKKDYTKNLIKRQKTIDNNKRAMDIDEINFDCFTTNQKMANRRIENVLDKMVEKNFRLLIEERRYKNEVRIKEDERKKLLEQIEEMRIYADFINEVLENNVSLFKKQILPDISSNYIPNYEEITKEVCERFYFLIDEKDKDKFNEEDLKVIKEINELKDSEILFDRFLYLKHNIIRTMKFQHKVDKDIFYLGKDVKKQDLDYEEIIERLEKELNLNKILYEREKSQYDEIYKNNSKGYNELDQIILDLYYEVLDTFEKSEKKNKNSKKKLIKPITAIEELQKILYKKEEKINKLIKNLEEYEKSNETAFYRMIRRIKINTKKMNFRLFKQSIENGEKEKIEKTPEKIIFINRKAEPPYRPPKNEKKIKLNPELIKQSENQQLITYK